MDKVRVGIIGVGGIANGKHMPSLAKLGNVEMVAFCDLIEERARKGAQEYGIDGAQVFTDYRRLLELEDVDVVHVLTTNDGHAPITIDALEAGKHVMCEKPMAINAAQARRMVETAERTGKKLTIGYQHRFRPDSQYLKRLITRGDLGRIYFAKALCIRRRGVPTWGDFLSKEKQGGGPLIDIGTHVLDLTLWLTGNYQPESAFGSAYCELGKLPNAANPWGSWDPEKFEVEDSAFGFIRFQDGMTMVLESSWALNTLQTTGAVCVLCGTKAGADMLDGLRINGEDMSQLYTLHPELDTKGVPFYDAPGQSPAEIEAYQWIDAVVNDREPLVKAREALVVSEIIDAVYSSAASRDLFRFTGK